MLPTRFLPAVEIRDLPDPPAKTWKIIGPGIVGAGIGLASGEFIIWPYIASQIGLFLLWGAVLGVAMQFFLNMEIERYTLATGETALTGFSRYWKHWGLVFAIMAYLANLWSGWATSSATMLTFLFGGEATWIAIGILIVIGLSLTLAPVVYQAVEKVIFLKVAAIGFFVVIAGIFAITGDAWSHLPDSITQFGDSFTVAPDVLGISLITGAVAFAGAGGGQNLCQSNWIRDKGFGMGYYVPRLVSPVTGQEEAIPSTGFLFPPNDENLSRWRRWWKFANLEQALTMPLITVVTIGFMSMLAYSTVSGQTGLAGDISFLGAEADALGAAVGPWFKVLFLAIGAFSLFAASMGIVDYTSRLGADVLKTSYLRRSSITENKLYFWLVWGLVGLGCVVLLIGVTQPLVLLVVSSCMAAAMMFIYSILLLVINKKALPRQIQIRSYRVVALVITAVIFGVLTIYTVIDQIGKFFAAE